LTCTTSPEPTRQGFGHAGSARLGHDQPVDGKGVRNVIEGEHERVECRPDEAGCG
jgi:hypothetical protein